MGIWFHTDTDHYSTLQRAKKKPSQPAGLLSCAFFFFFLTDRCPVFTPATTRFWPCIRHGGGNVGSAARHGRAIAGDIDWKRRGESCLHFVLDERVLARAEEQVCANFLVISLFHVAYSWKEAIPTDSQAAETSCASCLSAFVTTDERVRPDETARRLAGETHISILKCSCL